MRLSADRCIAPRCRANALGARRRLLMAARERRAEIVAGTTAVKSTVAAEVIPSNFGTHL